ncbi:hypothetical protein HNV11_12945 [Spirosoma taeanense]|uniref:Uncharacterized protein n=1 Tax=Spirosoma taeanense TaxID=2735870 RepID=A0A6M5Y761_9BACT|nr:hypothetical protein [Spirosoma taeanense]QJW90217.1 hypothetical protein HNV11_12945 [Spirosoma taeanense]
MGFCYRVCLWLRIAWLTRLPASLFKFSLVLSITLFTSFFTYYTGGQNTLPGHPSAERRRVRAA